MSLVIVPLKIIPFVVVPAPWVRLSKLVIVPAPVLLIRSPFVTGLVALLMLMSTPSTAVAAVAVWLTMRAVAPPVAKLVLLTVRPTVPVVVGVIVF
jgi:hypothetical protein